MSNVSIISAGYYLLPNSHIIHCRRPLFPPEPDIKQSARFLVSGTFLGLPWSSALQSFIMKIASSIIAATLLAASSLVGAVPIGAQEIKRRSADGLSLLRLGPDVDPVWKTEEEKWELKKAGIGFMDVTETWVDMQSNPASQEVLDLEKGVSLMTTCTLYCV
jgi:hypothetical protein